MTLVPADVQQLYVPHGSLIPPQAIDAEMAVLGAMLMGGMRGEAAADLAAEMLKPTDFYREAHGVLFDAMIALRGRDEPLDIVTVAAELNRRGKLDQAGDYAYLSSLAECAETAGNVAFHARIIADKAQLRRLIWAAAETTAACYREEKPAAEIAADAELAIFAASGGALAKPSAGGVAVETAGPILLGSVVRGELDELAEREASGNALIGYQTGFTRLDKILLGLRPGELHIMAARPSMGKSVCVQCIGRHVAGLGGVVGYFSLEMPRKMLMRRMMSAESGVKLRHILTGQGENVRWGLKGLSPGEWEELRAAEEILCGLPLLIDDTRKASPASIRSRCRRIRSQMGALDLVIVDHFHLMKPDPGSNGKMPAGETEMYSSMADGMQELAREMGVPVLLVAQLNRAVEARTDKKPVMSDLRGSGALEQNADSITMLYRPSYYERKEDKADGDFESEVNPSYQPEEDDTFDEVHLLVEKQRNGETLYCRVGFRASITKMENLTPRMF